MKLRKIFTNQSTGFKYFLSTILLIALLLSACGSNLLLVLEGTDQQEAVFNFDDTELSIFPRYTENFSIQLVVGVNSTKKAIIYPYRLKLEYDNEQLICDIMRNQRLIVENFITVNGRDEFFGYSCNEKFELIEGDKVLIYGDNYLKLDDKFYNIDSTYFELR